MTILKRITLVPLLAVGVAVALAVLASPVHAGEVPCTACLRRPPITLKVPTTTCTTAPHETTSTTAPEATTTEAKATTTSTVAKAEATTTVAVKGDQATATAEAVAPVAVRATPTFTG